MRAAWTPVEGHPVVDANVGHPGDLGRRPAGSPITEAALGQSGGARRSRPGALAKLPLNHFLVRKFLTTAQQPRFGGRGCLEAGGREVAEGRPQSHPTPKGSLRTAHRDWPFPSTSRRVGGSPISTQTEGNKSPLIPQPLPALLAAAWVPTAGGHLVLVLGAQTWSPCSLGTQTQAGVGGEGMPTPPHSTPPRAAPTPTLSLPGGGVVGHFHSQEHLTVWAPEAGVLQWVLPWPRPHPRPTEPCRMERKVAGSLEDQPPRITHLLHVPDPLAQTEEPDDVEQIPDMAWRLHL